MVCAIVYDLSLNGIAAIIPSSNVTTHYLQGKGTATNHTNHTNTEKRATNEDRCIERPTRSYSSLVWWRKMTSKPGRYAPIIVYDLSLNGNAAIIPSSYSCHSCNSWLFFRCKLWVVRFRGENHESHE